MIHGVCVAARVAGGVGVIAPPLHAVTTSASAPKIISHLLFPTFTTTPKFQILDFKLQIFNLQSAIFNLQS